MNYFEFKAGDYWASHSEPEYGFHAYPAWQALGLRNRLGVGDMVGAHWLRVPSRSVQPIVDPTAPPIDDAPLLGAYAFADADDYTVFVLSRSLTQTMRVKLDMPFGAADATTLYTLTGDPRAHTRYTNTVQISQTNVVGFGDGFTFDMPPGSVYAFRTESVTPIAVGAGPQAKVVVAPGQANATSERSMRFEVLFSEPVTGFDAADIDNAGTAGDVQWSVQEAPGSNHMRYRVTVSQVTSAGRVAPSIAAGRVVDADGNDNAASNIDAFVDFTPEAVGLLVREPFDGPARPLRGAAGPEHQTSASL